MTPSTFIAHDFRRLFDERRTLSARISEITAAQQTPQWNSFPAKDRELVAKLLCRLRDDRTRVEQTMRANIRKY